MKLQTILEEHVRKSHTAKGGGVMVTGVEVGNALV